VLRKGQDFQRRSDDDSIVMTKAAQIPLISGGLGGADLAVKQNGSPPRIPRKSVAHPGR